MWNQLKDKCLNSLFILLFNLLIILSVLILPENSFLLDVRFLFTSLPLNEIICCICDYVDVNNKDVGLLISQLKELLSRCTFSFQFIFNNQIYRKIDGISVRFPLGLPLAVCIIPKLEINQ